MQTRLLKWFEDNLPEVTNDLAIPATSSQIEDLENKLDIKLPKALKELYLVHNGQKCECFTGVFYGLTFLSLEKVAQHWQAWIDIIDSESEESFRNLSSFCNSDVRGMVKEEYANRKWVPFAYDYSGNFLGIDFDPDFNGTNGQIINFGRDEDDKYVLASSFEKFIEWYVNELESGNFHIEIEDDGGKSFNTKVPESGHFLDAAAIIFKREST